MGSWDDERCGARPAPVSIQLLSPASGEIQFPLLPLPLFWGFHSITFPSEWGDQYHYHSRDGGLVVFPFNYFPQRVGSLLIEEGRTSLTSRFPFNYFPQRVGSCITHTIAHQDIWVSIQLLSPASGERVNTTNNEVDEACFHSITFPSEWGENNQVECYQSKASHVSIQLLSPASGEG